ncbi:MAG: sulfotransferase [Gammaproteobacteria bacterium]|nr:sulfotransferase [Gammaproteobacteria bacterium]
MSFKKAGKYLAVDLVLLFKNIAYKVISYLPFPQQKEITIIIGCGRSGTTILGNSIAKHKNVLYLNEPRYIWSSIYPETDIWSRFSKKRKGVIAPILTTERKNVRLRRLFWIKRVLSRKKILVEKLPINTLRKQFLDQVFQKANYIVIRRNMEEVINSIQIMDSRERWSGHKDAKKKALVEFAMLSGIDKSKLEHVKDVTELSILEWVLCDRAISSDFADKNNCKIISYNDLVSSPNEVISKLFDFAGFPDDKAALDWAENNIRRRSKKIYNISKQHQDFRESLIR